MRVVGLMSGTSLDGVDVAVVDTDGETITHFAETGFRPYNVEEKTILHAALVDAKAITDRNQRPRSVAQAEKIITQAHVDAVQKIVPDLASIDLIGFHGQTVLHRPEAHLTVQIGDGKTLARSLGKPVVYDFRAADVAAGGQGAPLVPLFHQAVLKFKDRTVPTAVVNVGGVANVTFIAEGKDPVAFDTGPGNALMDDCIRARTGAPYDDEGHRAAQGKVDDNVLELLLHHPYFIALPPKSLDRNAFALDVIQHLSTNDALATLCAFTAQSIALSLKHAPVRPKMLIVSGGGAKNTHLIKLLQQTLEGKLLARDSIRKVPDAISVKTANSIGISSDSLEAQAFAYLAARSVRGLPITLPTTTGCPEPMTGGVIFKP